MDSSKYRLLGGGILIGAFAVTIVWLLSGEVSYRPDFDYEQRGAPLIITQTPLPTTTELQLIAPGDSALELLPSAEEQAIAELTDALPITTSEDQALPAVRPSNDESAAIVNPDNAAVDPASAASSAEPEPDPPSATSSDANLTPAQLQQAIAARDADINNLISSLTSTTETPTGAVTSSDEAEDSGSLWRIDIVSYSDPERANKMVGALSDLLQDELGDAEIFINRSLRRRTNSYFYVVVIANLPSEERARQLSVPIRDTYPDVRPRIREITP